mgnify:CR=1 FL=1
MRLVNLGDFSILEEKYKSCLDYFLLIAPLLIEGDRKELKDLEDGPEKDLENEENREIDGLE